MTDSHPWQDWYRLSSDEQVHQRIGQIYDEIGAAIAHKGPKCFASGKCCNFNAYGHLLYVTGLEIAWYVRQLPAGTNITVDLKAPCPFQIDGLCSTHAIRPLGCRVYFCQKGTEDWQQDLYEQFQQQLIALHKQNDIPYAYMEWRYGLQEALENR
jgi:Fe-S-cluster containining protein